MSGLTFKSVPLKSGRQQEIKIQAELKWGPFIYFSSLSV